MEQTVDITSLRSIGETYRQASASLITAWGTNRADMSFEEWQHLSGKAIPSLASTLESLQTWEGAARRIHGAAGCVYGKAGCPAEAIRDCDWCESRRTFYRLTEERRTG